MIYCFFSRLFRSRPSRCPRPRVFLIDGSSQMYRAYHAMRGGGLTGPGGKTTHAVYIFVTMLRKLIAGSPAAVHRRVVRSARPDVPRRHGHRLQGQPRADAAGSRRADSLGARGLRSAGRADPHLRALRGRRRDRHAGDEGGRPPASRWRSSPATRTSSSWCTTASRSTTRATKAPGSTPTGVKEKFGVAPAQVVDVLALMGDSIDNIKGVPGIGEKGARDLIATYGYARGAARARGRGDATSAIAKGCSSTPTTRGRAASWRGSAPTCRSTFDPEALRYRGASRERCFELFSRLGFRTLVMEFAPTAETVGKDYAVVASDRRASGRWSRSCSAAGRFALRVLPDAPSAMRAGIVGLVVLDRPRHARATCRSRASPSARRPVRPAGDRAASTRGPRSCDGGAGAAAAAARGRGGREDRPRPEVRRDRARRATA